MANKEISRLLDLSGKVAVVTGAASGIGRGIACRLAEAGAYVAILDIDEVRGGTTETELRGIASAAACPRRKGDASNGAKVSFYKCDVTKSHDCERVASAVYKEYGRVDILVNNAGVVRRKSVVDLTEEEWDLVIDVNLKGVYLVSKRIIPYMRKGGSGSIINIGSGWSLKGGPNAASYCASKGGVANLTRAMAIDHGPEGIRVNCICPGDTDTDLLRSEAVQLETDMDEFMREAAARPIKRVGQPEDIANAALFFASDMSSWVTGAVLVVDGGGLA